MHVLLLDARTGKQGRACSTHGENESATRFQGLKLLVSSISWVS